MIVTHPSDHLEVTPGSSITFSVDAEGLRFNFQWLRTDGGSLPSDPQRVVGADTSSLTLYLVEVGDMGVYVCEVYNGAGRVRSEEAMLTVSKLGRWGVGGGGWVYGVVVYVCEGGGVCEGAGKVRSEEAMLTVSKLGRWGGGECVCEDMGSPGCV